jgi:heat shock protein HslJ
MLKHTAARAALLLAAITPMLGACETLPEMAHPLTGETWRLTDIDTSGSSTRLTPALSERHTITFEEGGRAFVQLDCNRGNASWNAASPAGGGSGAITIGPVASTKMLCPQPSFGEQLASGLSGADRYTLLLDGRRLVIEADGIAFTFSAF